MRCATILFASLLSLSIAAAQAQQGMSPEVAAKHSGIGLPESGAPEVPAVAEATDLASGTIEVNVLGPTGAPEKDVSVRLGIVESSILKGDQRSAQFAVSDEQGVARFSGLQTTSSFAYRPLVEREGAKFEATPFRLSSERGTRVRLSVYPVTRSVEGLRLGMVVAVYMEPKDDRIQFEELVSVYNLSSSAWLPQKSERILLPEGVTGFQAQEGMTDTGIEKEEEKETGKVYARLRGTFGPGEHRLMFSYQVPSEKARFEANLAIPARTAQLRIMAARSGKLKLDVPGMPEVRDVTLENGMRVWGTEISFDKQSGNPSSYAAALSGLPSRGIWPTVVTGVASLLMVGAAVGAFLRRRRGMTGGELSELVAELKEAQAGLKDARAAGEVGPQTYAREMQKLQERLARALLQTTAVDKLVNSSG